MENYRKAITSWSNEKVASQFSKLSCANRSTKGQFSQRLAALAAEMEHRADEIFNSLT